jgi:phosphatidylglycerophosphate synthase
VGVEPGVFGGQTNVGRSLLSGGEIRLKAWLADRVPDWIGTRQLTLVSVPLSGVLLSCGIMAPSWRGWWLVASAVIVAQYLTDLVDGEIGRRRGSGLVRWGFYADHLLDFIFLSIGLAAYILGVPAVRASLSIGFMLIVQTMIVSSYLEFGVTGVARYKRFGVGPTELRLSMVLVNVALFFFGSRWLALAAPSLVASFGLLLVAWVVRGQRLARWIDEPRRDE